MGCWVYGRDYPLTRENLSLNNSTRHNHKRQETKVRQQQKPEHTALLTMKPTALLPVQWSGINWGVSYILNSRQSVIGLPQVSSLSQAKVRKRKERNKHTLTEGKKRDHDEKSYVEMNQLHRRLKDHVTSYLKYYSIGQPWWCPASHRESVWHFTSNANQTLVPIVQWLTGL